MWGKVTPSEFLAELLGRWLMIVIVALVVAVLGSTYALTQAPKFQVTAVVAPPIDPFRRGFSEVSTSPLSALLSGGGTRSSGFFVSFIDSFGLLSVAERVEQRVRQRQPVFAWWDTVDTEPSGLVRGGPSIRSSNADVDPNQRPPMHAVDDHPKETGGRRRRSQRARGGISLRGQLKRAHDQHAHDAYYAAADAQRVLRHPLCMAMCHGRC